MAENKILEFARNAAALVLTDAEYSADVERTIGHQPGVARANFANKISRQANYMAAVLAQFIVDYAVETVQDSDTVALAVLNLAEAVSNVSGFDAGTKMVFYQAVAPTGWTQDVTKNDMALRVVSGTGGGIGGTHDLSTPPSTSHVHSGPSHSHTTGNVTLTAAQSGLPEHQHGLPFGGAGAYTGVGTGISSNIQIAIYSQGVYGGAQNASAPHNHGATSDGGTGSTGSTTPTAFAPKYIDIIVATKD